MKTLITPIFLIAGLTPLGTIAQQAFDPGVPAPVVGKEYYEGALKAVYHINVSADQKGYLGMMGNIRNHLDALSDAGVKGEIRVVMNGDGLGALQLAKQIEFEAEARLPGAINALKQRGVQFQVCYRTLTGRKIHIDALFDVKKDDLIPSGVAEVARLQSMGYQLVKP